MIGLLNNVEIKATEHLTISENDAFNAGCKAQRPADIKWFIEWGNEICIEHERELIKGGIERHLCYECWQSFKQLVEE